MMMCKTKTEKEINRMVGVPNAEAQIRSKKLLYFFKNLHIYNKNKNWHKLLNYLSIVNLVLFQNQFIILLVMK